MGNETRYKIFSLLLYSHPCTAITRFPHAPFQVYESLVVNEYLSESFPPGGEDNASPLLPKSPAARAKARVMAQRSNDLVTAYFTYLSNKDEVNAP